ncbi:hypothetical protein JTB14_015388 [Gonioctena quinquepunctata]|nr:hypothetical protein JTB14_015388 [Gonioctena quinquepunctata]
MKGDLLLEDFSLICRICLTRNDLKPFVEEKSLQKRFMDITDIQVETQDSLPKNVCGNCLSTLEDISLFIDLSKYNNIGFLQDLINEKEKLYICQKDEITIIDDGMTIKIEQDYGDNDVTDYHSTGKQMNKQIYEVKNGKKSDERTNTNSFLLVCRICLAKENLRVFDGEEHLINVFRNITNIVVTTQDELPKNICSRCIDKLQGISSFIELSKSNNTKLHQVFSTQQDDISLEKSVVTTVVHEIKKEDQFRGRGSPELKFSSNFDQSHTCGKCGDTFSTKRGLMNHQKHVHTSDGRHIKNNDVLALWKCGLCNKDFPTSLSEDKHMESHFGNDFLLCFICGRAFIKREEFLLHITVHSVKEKKYSDKSSGNNRNNKSKEIQKNISDGILNNKSHLCDEKESAKKKKPRKILAIAIRGLRQRSFQCKCFLCLKYHMTRQCLSKHLETHKDEKEFKCTICSKTFSQRDNLKKHLATHNEVGKHALCEVCSKMVVKQTLSSHMKTHTERCTKRFSHKNSLKIHLRIHSGEKPFECQECSAKFNRQSHLKSHTRVHTGEQPYQCEICFQKFSHKNSLTNHLRRHLGIKKFKCTGCSKVFGDSKTLKVHSRIHTGEKPYTCSVCSTRFAHYISFKKHLRTHSGEKPYSCHVCSKNFAQKSYISQHFKKMHKDTTFSCTICSKSFPKEGHLKMHERMAAHKGMK